MNELLPCPFCGGEAEVRTKRNHGSMSWQTLYRIRCSECQTGQHLWSGCLSGTEWGAVEMWNRRTDSTHENEALLQRVERLSKEVEGYREKLSNVMDAVHEAYRAGS